MFRSKVAVSLARIHIVAAATVLLVSSAAYAQRAPAPSQVTPRSLRPEQPVQPPPTIQLGTSAPAEAPPDADKLHVSVREIVVEGGYPELAATTRRLLAPFEGRQVSIAELFKAAGALEQAYAGEGYFLVRIVVPEQPVADGGTFRLQLVDGYIEQVDVSAVPARIRAPIRRIMTGVEGRRRLRVVELQARLEAAGQTPGATLRSTLAQGETPGGARLILDGGYKPFAVSLTADNRLGPAFNDWGMNLQLTANSPTGNGEQAYVFLSGGPRVDQTFHHDATRRVIGGGLTAPLGGGGLQINPEFTASDTRPISANPLLGSHGVLYRGALNWLFPTPRIPGAQAKLTTEWVDETETLPAFGLTLSHDRLTVLRADLTWNGGWVGRGVLAEATVSQGVGLFGARSPEDGASGVPFSRGSNPRFTKLEARLGVTQPLPAGAALNLTVRGQTSFGNIVPSSETFDLASQDSLSPFTSGALTSDSGVGARAQIERQWVRRFGGLGVAATPYLFASGGFMAHAEPDPFSPRRAAAYGVGVRLAAKGLTMGGMPTVTIEFGHGQVDRGQPSTNSVMASLGVAF